MDEMLVKIKTSLGDAFSKTFNYPEKDKIFFDFKDNPYIENPEFTNNIVLGSGGTIPHQIILRIEPQGDKTNPNPHLHIDEGYLKDNEKRTRKTLEHWKIPNWIEIKINTKKKNYFKKIVLSSKKK